MFASFFFLFGFGWLFSFAAFSFWVWLELCFLVMLFILMSSSSSTSLIFFVLFEYIFSIFFFLWSFFGVDWMLTVFLIGKMGLFPFWFWVVRIFQEFDLRISLLVVSFYKSVIIAMIFYGGAIFPFFLLLALNFLSGFFLVKSVWDANLFLCFSSIFSSGWFFVFGCGEALFAYFAIYCVMFMLLLFIGRKGYSKSFAWLFFWCFYLGYPFFLSFFLKLVGVFYMVESSFILGFLVILNSLFFIFSAMLMMQESLFVVGLVGVGAMLSFFFVF